MNIQISKNKKSLGSLLFLGALLCQSAQAQVTIGIEGLSGAEHWTWINGRTATAGPGSSYFFNNVNVSGWVSGGPVNGYRRDNNFSAGTASWDVYAPAAMSSDTKAYVRAGVQTGSMAVDIDGSTVSVANTVILDIGNSNPLGFAEWEVDGSSVGYGIGTGSLTAGTHEITYTADSAIKRFNVNGILLYDGNADIPFVSDNGNGLKLLGNPGSLDSPELLGPSVLPNIVVSGLGVGNIVQYTLNGASYTPGTAIGPGTDYELVISIFEDSTATSQRIGFAGANFSVVPEPGTYALFVGSFILSGCLLRRRRS